MPSTLLCVHAPRGLFRFSLLALLPSATKTASAAYQAIIFAHILVSLACAIEMQHDIENCSSIVVTNLEPASWATAYWPCK